MQYFHNLTAILSLIGPSSIEKEFGQILKDICLVTYKQKDVRTFMYTKGENLTYDHLNVPNILQALRTQHPFAVINVDVLAPIKHYRDLFNHNFLSILQLSQNATSDKHLLNVQLERLHWSSDKPIILLLDDTANETYVKMLFEFSAKRGAINVIALQPQMAVREREYWKFLIFPIHKTVRQAFEPFYHAVFFNHLKNMHGRPLRLMKNGWYPKAYNYTLADGSQIVSGYMGRAFAEYARIFNATLQYPYFNENRPFYHYEVRGALKNGSVDVGLLSRVELDDIKLSSTTVVHRKDWCLMIPVENPLPPCSFFYKIMETYVNFMFCFSLVAVSCIWAFVSRWKNQRQPLSVEYLINVSVLQGLLGMTFWLEKRLSIAQKLICIAISFAGVLFGTAYNAYLQSFTVNAPTESQVKTIEDVLNRGIKIAVATDNIYWITHYTNMSRYVKNFTIFTNYTNLLLLRNSFDTRYAFLVSDMWPIYDEQQKYFSRPIFRITDICFGKDMPLVLPLPANSVYRSTLNKLFLMLQEAGLIKFWLRHTFIELTALDIIKLKDGNEKPGFKAVQLDDLRVVFIVMSALILFSIFTFILELYWVKMKKASHSTVCAMKDAFDLLKIKFGY